MGSEWETHTFEELIEKGSLLIGDGYRAKNEELGGAGHIFLRAGHVTDTHIDLTGVERFHASLSEKVASKMAKARDVVITTKGNSTGRTTYISADLPPLVYSPHLSFWRSTEHDVIFPEFLRYWARGQQFQSQLEGFKVSTDMAPYLSLVDQKRLRITLPLPKEQRGIAEILSALDDKIELNRRMNATLERLAQALFKSWFVDFDPVKAKAEGREPEGMDSDTAALFPSEFEESELGPIPKGWRRGKLGELCFNHRVGVKPGEVESDTPYIGLEHMPRKCIALNDWAYVVEAESGKSSFSAGDILFGKLRPYFHKVGVAPVDGVCSTDILVIRPIAQEFFGVALGHLSSVEVINYADKLSNGAKMPRTKWEDLAAYQIAIPPMDIAARLSTIALVFVERIRGNIAELRRLAELRDALLPRLISGQIRIPDIEQAEGGV